MGEQVLIPVADPIALPAPFWLFKLLLVVTFTLHVLAMNFLVGSSLIAALARLRAGGSDFARRLFGDLTPKIPSLVAATVTLGVAPLLFLQVLYGQYFYSSSVVLGWPWFSVVVLVTLAYYGFYIVAFRGRGGAGVGGWLPFALFLLVAAVGFVYTSNLTLMSAPEAWGGKYFRDPSGMNLNLGDPTVVPRFLHFLVGAVAVGGLFSAFMGWFRWKGDPDYGRSLIRHGGRWFMFTTMAQFAVGIWFLVALPRERMMLFMGDHMPATAAFGVGILAALGSIFVMSDALRREDPRRGFLIAVVLAVLTLAAMILMRETLRDADLGAWFDAGSFPVSTQWDVLGLFLALFVAGIILWLVMLRRYFATPARS